MSFLPTLWKHSTHEFLVKQAILGILSSLVSSTKGSSQKYHSQVIPLIDSSVDVRSETYIQLAEDAMDLWEAILQQTPASNVPDLLRLVPRLFPMLEAGSDNLGKALKIMEKYIYVAPKEMFSVAGPILFPLASLLAGSKREIAGSILDIVELLVQTGFAVGGPDAVYQLVQILFETRFLQTLVEGLRGAHEAHQSTGPNRVKTWLDILIETSYLSALSRLAISSPDLLLNAISATCPNEEIDHAMTWFLTEWFTHLDNISHPDRKKLSCLALTGLLRTGQTFILTRLQELMAMWTEIALDLYDDEGEKSTSDSLVYSNMDALKGEQETLQQERSRTVSFQE